MTQLTIRSLSPKPLVAGNQELLTLSFPITDEVKEIQIYPSQTFRPLAITTHFNPYIINISGHFVTFPLPIQVASQPLNKQVKIEVIVRAGTKKMATSRIFPAFIYPSMSPMLPNLSENLKTKSLTISKRLINEFYHNEAKFFDRISQQFLSRLEKYQQEQTLPGWRNRLRYLLFASRQRVNPQAAMELHDGNGRSDDITVITPTLIRATLQLAHIIEEREPIIRHLVASKQSTEPFQKELVAYLQDKGLPPNVISELVKHLFIDSREHTNDEP